MRWSISRTDEGKWQVIDADGKVISAFDSHSEAMQALATALDTVVVDPGAEQQGSAFEATFLENEETVDRRVIELNATNFDRPFPLPWMMTTQTSYGHEGATLVGVITEGSRNGATVTLRGRLDTSPEAQEYQRLVGEGMMTTWSPDMGDSDSMIEVIAEDQDGWPTEIMEHVMSCTLLGGTGVPFQALNSAKIRLIDDDTIVVPTDSDTPADATDGDATAEDQPAAAVAAAAVIASIPNRPPGAWFQDPEFKELTPLTITDDGHIFGHVAEWGQCHIGREDVCITPPSSPSDYAYYRTGAVLTAEGDTIAVGTFTMGTGHAVEDASVTAQMAIEHYDHTGTAVADFAAGEDAFGPWVNGALRADLSESDIRALRGASPSGDWRRVGGSLEMVAVLAVNVPGFPIPRAKTLVASGVCMALTAAGARAMAPALDRATADAKSIATLQAQIDAMQPIIDALTPDAIEKLSARIHAV